MYETNSRFVEKRYASRISGCADGVVLVLSGRALGPAAVAALESSARALGFGERACCFCALRDEEGSPLAAASLLEVVEGIDPVVLVVADSDAARSIGEAYRTDVPPLARSRILGRTAVAFRSFERMLDDPANKQKAWAVLKQLAAPA